MKYLISFIVLLFSLTSIGQTVVVKPTDSVIIFTTTVTVIPKVTPPVNQPNQPPVSFAGSNQVITLPVNSVTLSGTATDKDGRIVSTVWTKSTNLASTIVSANNLNTSVTGMAQGTHIFKLTVVDDSNTVSTSTVNIVVNPSPVIDTSSIKGEGFGSQAIGGSQSSALYSVKTAAQFTAAIGSNRTIRFDADVTISGSAARVDLAKISYLTIDGNGFDVSFLNGNNGDGISFNGANTHHCILRGVRVIGAGNDGINIIDGANNILITNCSSYGNHDGDIDIAADNTGRTSNVTVQYCVLGSGQSDWSGSMLITAQNVSVHHNLFYSATPNGVGERNSLTHANYSPIGNPNMDFRNNVVLNWGRSNGTGSGYGTAIGFNATGNIIGNYYKSNASQSSAAQPNDGYGSNGGFAYIANNISGNNLNPNTKSNHAEYSIPSQFRIETSDACVALSVVISKAGLKRKNITEQVWFDAAKAAICQ